MTSGSSTTLKEQVHELADELPDDATWDDVIYEAYIRGKIARGLADAEAGRTVTMDEIKRRFRLPSRG